MTEKLTLEKIADWLDEAADDLCGWGACDNHRNTEKKLGACIELHRSRAGFIRKQSEITSIQKINNFEPTRIQQIKGM